MTNLGLNIFWALVAEIVMIGLAIALKDDKRKMLIVLFIGTVFAGCLAFSQFLYSFIIENVPSLPIVSIPTQQSALISHTPVPGSIPFYEPNQPGILNEAFRWQPGRSSVNSYDLTLYPNALLITAGTDTVQYAGFADTAPYITYELDGDFDVQVKVVFSPSQDTQAASLGIRSVANQNTWLRISRYHYGGQIVWAVGNRDGSELRLNSVPYSRDTIYFKIERRNLLFNLSYSADGNEWFVLQKEYIFELPSKVEAFLSVYSIFNAEAVRAVFYDFMVIDR